MKYYIEGPDFNICMAIVSLWLLIVYMDAFLVGMAVAIHLFSL